VQRVDNPPYPATNAGTGRVSHLAQLQAITAQLSGAHTVAEVGAVTVATVAEVLRADRGALLTLSPDRRVLDVVDAVGFEPTVAAPGRRFSLDDDHPVVEAVLTQEPVTLRTGAGASYSGSSGTDDDHRLEVALPLGAREGAVGVVAFGWADRSDLGADDRVLLETVALQLGQALERARLHDASLQTAQLLQSTLLPSQIPRIPGLQVAARYQPVEDGAVIGGDFYDVFLRGDGRSFGLSIGDVSGKGVRAASLTALARHTIRAASRRTSSPADVLAELNEAILADDMTDRYLTAAHLVLQPEHMATKVALSLGGHPQPLLRSADRSVRAVGHPGSAVGLLDRGQWIDEHLTLAAGNVLVLFTDGITDVRNPCTGELAGDLVADVLARSGAGDAEALADEIMAEVLQFAGGARRDDIALLVLHPQPS
jgi:serine phosphatase RsbU (regulator of sigma subunit)